VFLDHAPREFCDIGLIEVIGRLEINFLNVEELPVPFDFVTDVVHDRIRTRPLKRGVSPLAPCPRRQGFA
jgi:hypothetical protein